MIRRIIPLVRLSCKNSIKLARAINSPIIVIPVYDVILDSTAEPNELFRKIKSEGGLHKSLNYNGIIILSSIMRDDLIKKIKSPEQYAEIINGLNPNFYFTPDGKTYEKQDQESLNEIMRLYSLTRELIELCSNSQPIGLVKGSNALQIKIHRDLLKGLGINTFVFHTGDFFRQGNEGMIQKAKYYCSLIKKEDNTLMLYGLGSPRRMLEFSFSDMFITYSHFVNAKHRIIFNGTKREKFLDKSVSVYRLAIHNFKEFLSYLKGLKHQTKLFMGGKCKWVEASQELHFIIQGQKVKK